ncbi:MAG: tetratricopeptide repeat-containing sensor histidine kinase [Gammaproteobacteria bacterium]|nr:tetratricopeptide repeat-containing sensor histidine kinase [Gammaproteobacteria bacterium]
MSGTRVFITLFLASLLALGQAWAAPSDTEDVLRLEAELSAARGEARGPAYFALVDHFRTQAPDRAMHYAEAALAEPLLSPRDRARILAEVCFAEAIRGRFPEAMKAGLESARLARELGDEPTLERALNNIGSVYYHLGQWLSALDYYQQSLRLVEKRGDIPALIGRLNNIGNVYVELRQYEQALTQYRRALPEAERDLGKYAEIEASIGIVLTRMNRYGEALPLLEASLERSRKERHGLNEVVLMQYLAQSKLRLGRTDEARQLLAQAKVLAGARQLHYKLPSLHQAMGQLELESGQAAAARREAEQGLEQAAKLGRKADERPLLQLLADSQRALGLDAEAYQTQTRLLQAVDENYDQNLSANIALLQVSFAQERREHEIALLKRDNELKAGQLEREKVLRWVGGAALVGLAILALALLSRHMHRRELTRVRRLNEELRRLAEIKGQMLARTSHELLTPLNGLLGMTQLVLDEARDELDAENQTRLRTALDCGHRLSGLVSDMLAYSQAAGGNLSLSCQSLPLRAAVVQALDQVRASAEHKGLRLQEHIASGLPAVRADPQRLQQILHLLLDNAVKFTPAGWIAVDAERRGGFVRCRVRDSGPGLSLEERERIFECLEQGDNRLNRAHGGAGLGLALCRQLLRLQGGELGVEEPQGPGSCFWFTLPVAV